MTISLDRNLPQLFPADLLTSTVIPGRWRIARTKSRREKALAELLANRGIGYCLPMVKKRQHCTKRVRYSLMPVFPGYLFFKSSDQERYQAFCSNHIAGVIDVRDEDQLLRDLSRIHMAITLDAPVYPYDFVRQGSLVEIVRGPLKGLQGIVLKKSRNYRLVLNVNCLTQALAVDIEAHCIEPLLS
jgi:transcription antitermination factor NusG